MKVMALEFYVCDDMVGVTFEIEGSDLIVNFLQDKMTEEKRFRFPIGKPIISSTSIVRSASFETHPTYDGFSKTFFRHMDHIIPLEEIINTPQEELNEKYFDKQFEKRYPHRVEKVKPVRKARAKQVTEKKENCGCKKNLKGNEKNKKTKKNH